MRIQNNMMAMNTQRNLSLSSTAGAKSMGKLSSGYRINSAADDAAGLSISEKMRGQIRGLGQASRNAQDGISMIQTAEGALGETHSILQRMREITVQAANDTNSDVDRQAVGQELQDLTAEIDRISQTTSFNEKKLLNGDLGGATVSGTSEVVAGTTLATGAAAAITSLNVDGAKAGTTYTFTSTALGKLTATRSGDSVAQTITLDGTIGADGTMGLNFSELGIKMTISGASGKTDANVISDLTAVGSDSITTANGSDSAQFAIGANGVSSEKMSVSFSKFDSSTLGTGVVGAATKLTALLSGSVSTVINTAAKADALTASIDDSIKQVSIQRSKLGAAQNRLEHTIKNLDNTAENLQAAESRVRDVDMAKEMMEFTKNNILNQAATAMLAQANQAPQAVLQLLRG